MVGLLRECGIPTPFQGLVYTSSHIPRQLSSSFATCPTPSPSIIRQPLKRGWITLSPVTILPCYGRLCLHQPLSGVAPYLTRGQGAMLLFRLRLCLPAPLTLRRANTRDTHTRCHPPQPPLRWRSVEGCRGLCFCFPRTAFPV